MSGWKPRLGIRARLTLWYVAAMNTLFGFFILVIDLHAGLPLFWTLGEGPPIIMFGIVLALLNRLASR